jgi:hypothetical protein
MPNWTVKVLRTEEVKYTFKDCTREEAGARAIAAEEQEMEFMDADGITFDVDEIVEAP